MITENTVIIGNGRRRYEVILNRASTRQSRCRLRRHIAEQSQHSRERDMQRARNYETAREGTNQQETGRTQPVRAVATAGVQRCFMSTVYD